ncbi:macro domain-containing protein [Celerinatantimonas sp. YJH-8]|uniref:macro domain-containing protein n=1 Tax=Celerinatantimonas sp. YJH-8 TaxID=3228714 RepID=UPI0038C8BA45
MSSITILSGDITGANVDAIVNAANPTLLGGGVDGAIHRAAGPALLAACYKIPEIDGCRCPFGEARITAAGQLSARFVIHAVGPIYRQESDPARVLRSAYTHACQLALQNDCHTVAFPAISCGVYGYPHQEAAYIALSACSAPEFSSLAITFYLYEPKLLALFRQVTQMLPGV